MDMIRRIAAFILAVVTVLASLAFIVAASGLIPSSFLFEAIEYVYGSKEAVFCGAAVGVYCLIVAVLSFPARKKSDHSDDIVLIDAKGGRVNIASSVISGLAVRAAAEVSGVREVQATAQQAGEGAKAALAVRVDVTINSEANMRQISESVRASVQNALLRTADINDAAIEVKIAEIAQAAKKTDRRVV